MPEQSNALVRRGRMALTPEIIKEYGIRALVHEVLTEDIEDGRVIRRTIKRQRVEFG